MEALRALGEWRGLGLRVQGFRGSWQTEGSLGAGVSRSTV